VNIDPDAAYRALQSRDARFDGVFYVGVRTTGIYCRPSCAARTPHRHNVDFFPSAAAAQRCGLRACKRCRPDATPGSPDWNVRADLAGRAVRLIGDGMIDREGVPGLARTLGYSERQVTRALVSEMGAPPLALARAQRARTARILLESSALPIADVAFAAGFASIRQFNDTMREVFDATPRSLRARRQRHRLSIGSGAIELRLAYRTPMAVPEAMAFIGTRAVAGLEEYRDTTFTRTLRLPYGAGLVALDPASGFIRARLQLEDHRDLGAAVSRVRRMLDLDADPVAVDETLSAVAALRAGPAGPAGPGGLGGLGGLAGLRSPGAVDGFEMAVRAIVGQQVSVGGARTVLSRLVKTYGEPVTWAEADADSQWWLFPTAERMAEVDPAELPMPRARGRTIHAVARAMADHHLVLDGGSDREQVRAQLLALPGIGPWTADYLRMRALGDPDVFLDTDLGVRRAISEIGEFDASAAAPWRSYLTHHLWRLDGSTASITPIRKGTS